jgi:pre-mRNA-splicing factor SYF1
MIVFESEDFIYEEDVIRNPSSLKSWIRYIDFKTKTKVNLECLYLIYERALKQIPGSYKIWYNYIKLRKDELQCTCIINDKYEALSSIYDRALAYMNKVILFNI